jgi:hypothetical protein
MEIGVAVLVSVLSSSVVAGMITLWGQRRHALWETRRAVGLRALAVSTARLSNVVWTSGGQQLPVSPQLMPSIEDCRAVHDELTVYCRRNNVVDAFLDTIFIKEGTTADVLLETLRDAIRKEFGLRKIPHDPDRALIARL